jgi:hypothetical protein
MAKRIQLRRDIKANWEAIDPILAQGEIGLDLVTKNFKIGDGVTRWNNLTYAVALGRLDSEFDPNTFLAIGPVSRTGAIVLKNEGIETLVAEPNIITISVQTLFTANIPSTDPYTGTVIVQGGVGISGDLNVDGDIVADSLTISSALQANVQGNVTGNVFGDLVGDVYSSAGVKILENGTDGTDAIFTGRLIGTVTQATGTSELNRAIVSGGFIDNTVIGNTNPTVITGTQITATNQFVGKLNGTLVGDVFANDGTTKILENGTGGPTNLPTYQPPVFYGNVQGSISGNFSGDIYAADGTTKILENGTGGTPTDPGYKRAEFIGDFSGDITSFGLSRLDDVDINGGNIDNTFIGAAQPRTITGTVITATERFVGEFEGSISGPSTGDIFAENEVKVFENGTDGYDSKVYSDLILYKPNVIPGGPPTEHVILDRGTTGTDAMYTGNVTGNLTGNVTSTTINTTDLTVTNDATIQDSLTVVGTSQFTGDMTAVNIDAATLDTTGNVSVQGNVSITGTLGVTAQSTFTGTVTTNNITAADINAVNLTSSNDTTVQGDLTVVGTANLSNLTLDNITVDNINVNEDVNIADQLNVSGLSTLQNVDIKNGFINNTVIGNNVPREITTTQLQADDITILNQGEIRLKELAPNGNNYVGLRAPEEFINSYTLTFPRVLGVDGAVLSLNKNGNKLEFVSADLFGGGQVTVSATNGDDNFDGINKPVKTIKRALQIASGLVYEPKNNFNVETCNRDVGLMIEAVAWDTVYGSNWQSIKSGITYSNATATAVITSQKDITLRALNQLKIKINATQTGTEATTMSAKMQTIIDIFTAATPGTILIPGSGAVPAVVMPDPSGTDSGISNAKELLLDNVDFIAAEIIAYINTNFVGFSYTGTTVTKCERDIGYIIDAALFDAVLGTNYNSVLAGQFYYQSSSAYVLSNQKLQTKLAIRKSIDYTTERMNSATFALGYRTAVENLITVFENNGVYGSSLVYPTYAGIDPNRTYARDNLLNNIDFIREEIIAWIDYQKTNNVAPFTSAFVYDSTACSNDVKRIVEALIYDIMYGGNQATYRAAEAYFLGGTLQLGAGEEQETIAALNRLKVVVNDVISNQAVITTGILVNSQNTSGSVSNKGTTAQALIDIIRDTVTVGDTSLLNNLQYPSIQWANNVVQGDVTTIQGQKAQIKTQVSAYITAEFNNFSYATTKCERDVKYIVYSVAYDLLYGGNSQTVDAAKKYYSYGSGPTLIVGEQAVSAEAYQYAKYICSRIATNQTVTPYQNTVTQVTGSAGSASAVDKIEDLFDIISTVINYGPNQAPIAMDPNAMFTGASSTATLTAARNNLRDKKGEIQSYVVAYIADFQPNENRIVISVASGDYYEDNPIIIPDNVSVVGAGLRACNIRPLNANKDMLRVRNGCYFTEITFRDGLDINKKPSYTFDYAVAFDDANDPTCSRAGYNRLPISKPVISISPYVQNCSIISFLGGNGVLVDGSKVATPNVPKFAIEAENPVEGPVPQQGKSMVGNAFTMLSFGGTGYRVINDAYAQIVSCFQIFCLNGSYVQSGGYLSITNSATNFGQFALRANGYSPNAFDFNKGFVVTTGTSGAQQTITAIGFGDLPVQHYVIRFREPAYRKAYSVLIANKEEIRDTVIAWITAQSLANASPFYPGFETSYNIDKCKRDIMLLIEAVAYDVISGGNSKSVEAGLSYANAVVPALTAQKAQNLAAFNKVKLEALAIVPFITQGIVGDRFDLINSIITDVINTPEVVDFSNVGDITNSFKPADPGNEKTFDPNTAINFSTNIFTITAHGYVNGEKLVYDSNTNTPIFGLYSEQVYHVDIIDVNSFKLFTDESKTLPVNVEATPTPVGIHKFIKNVREFFIDDLIESHKTYQKLTLAAGSYNFVQGREITGTSLGVANKAYVLNFDNTTNQLIVSIEKVSTAQGFLRNIFTAGGVITNDHTAGTPISSINISTVENLSNYYTATFKILPVKSGSELTNLEALPEKQIWLHRPSICNSSSHTWEYAGSGIDYNALPQNGGKTKVEYEQVSELPGRVYSSGTNELGDFKVGDFIKAENKTGNVQFTNTVTIAALDALKLAVGNITIEEFSADIDLGDNEIGGPSHNRLSTQKAVRSFLQNRLGFFIDREVATSTIPGAIPQLNALGKLNADLIPPIRNFLVYRSNGYRSRLALVDAVPPNNVLNGDLAIEEYSSVQLVLNGILTANDGDLITQAGSGATGRVIGNTGSTNVLIGSVEKLFGIPFNTTGVLSINGVATSPALTPTSVGAVVTDQTGNYILSEIAYSQFLLLDPTQTYNFTGVTSVTGSNSEAQGTITSLRSGVVNAINILAITPGQYNVSNITYRDVPLTGGTGTGATADITINASGNVSDVDLKTGGSGYTKNDVLSAANASLGGGTPTPTPFSVTVTEIQNRVYVNILGGKKFTASTLLNEFTEDSAVVTKTITVTNKTEVTFNAASTGTGGNVNTAQGRITITSHPFSNGDAVKYDNNAGTPLAGLAINGVYFVKVIDTDTIELWNTYNLTTKMNISGSGSGTQKLIRRVVEAEKNLIYLANHGYKNGDPVKVIADVGSTLPINLENNTIYFVGSIVDPVISGFSSNAFSLHTSRTDAENSKDGLTIDAVDLSDDPISEIGTGTANFRKQNVRIIGTVDTGSVQTNNWSSLSANNVDAANIISGIINTSRMATGTANSDTFLRGDSTWQRAVQKIKTPSTNNALTLQGSYFDPGTGQNEYYNTVTISTDVVDGNDDESGFTRLGVSKFLKSQFEVGTGASVGRVSIKNGVVDAGTLDGEDGLYYLTPSNFIAKVPVTKGGTDISSYTIGDMLYASASSTLSKLATSTVNKVLHSVSGAGGIIPAWTDTITLNGLTVNGNVNITGAQSILNAYDIEMDDNNIKLGAVSAITNRSGTINFTAVGALTTTATGVGISAGMIPGMTLSRLSGADFGSNARVVSIDSPDQFTFTADTPHTTGAVIFNVDGATDATANGGGITIVGTTNKSLSWTQSINSWTSSENFNLLTAKTYKINGNDVLTSTTLGSGVLNSSLQTVGTIGTGVWQGTIISPTYGGTGINNGSKTITLSGNLSTVGESILSGVIVSGIAGQFSCTATPFTLAVGDNIVVSGTITTGTGSITGYTNPKTYKIQATNGSTTFTLINTDNSAIVTSTGASGTTTGLTFTRLASYSTTLNLSNNTNINVPSTGTLATLAGVEALTNKTLNGMTVTNSTGTFTLANGKTLTNNNTVTFNATDNAVINLAGGGDVIYKNSPIIDNPTFNITYTGTGALTSVTFQSAYTTDFKSRISSVGNANRFSWLTNLNYNGTAFIKDNLAKSHWVIDKVITTTDTTSYISFSYGGPTVVTSTDRLRVFGTGRTELLAGISSTNITTGTLVVTGGVGISENLNVGGNLGVTTNLNVSGNAVISGNLTVSGTTTIINTETIELADNIIVLNSNETAAPTQNAGIEIERGTATNVSLLWDEAVDKWTFGAGSTLIAGTFEGNITGSVTGNAASATKLETARTISLGGDLSGSSSFDGTGNITINATIQGDSVALGADTTGNYVQSVGAGTPSTQSGTSGLSISGTGEGATVTISHANTSDQANISSDNSGNTFIQDISLTFDNFGHVTAASVGTGTVSIGDGTLTVQGSSGLTGSGTFTANQSTAGTITLSHADTSSVADLSSDNSGNTFIQDIGLSFDGFGHVTGASVVTGTVSIGDGTLTVQGSNGLTGSGTFTANQSTAGTITLSVDSTVVRTSGDQSIAGAKTFTGGIYVGTAMNFGTANLQGSIYFNSGTNSYGLTKNGGGGDIFTVQPTGISIDGVSTLPKANANTSQFLRGDGTWQTVSAGVVSGLANSATITATSANTANQIVLRDASGNFSAGTITATFSGNLTGNVTGNVTGSSGSCTGNAATATTAGSITGQANSATITATSANTANQIVLRDANGDFNARYINSSYFNSSDDVNTGNISYIMAKFGDNYHRSASAAKVAAFISGQTMNINGSSTSCSGNAASITNQANSATITATSSNVANQIVLRDASGNFSAGTMTGIATQAKYADLAENYLADAEYDEGTVLMIGGEFELTLAENETPKIAGVVSKKPAHLMNSELQGKHVVAVALQGRVPIKVKGKIHKGDLLVSAGDGYAKTYSFEFPVMGTVIGKALENFSGEVGVIEAIVGRL